MRPRRDRHLLARHGEVDQRDIHAFARMLQHERAGLLRVYRYHRYQCVDASDGDFRDTRAHPCSGYGVLREGGRGPVDCRACGRLLDVTRKRSTLFFAIQAVPEAILDGVLRAVRETGMGATAVGAGHVLATATGAHVHLVLVDQLKDPAPLSRDFAEQERAIYLWSEEAYRGRLPVAATAFPLIDVFEDPMRFRTLLGDKAERRPWEMLPAALRRERYPEPLATAPSTGGRPLPPPFTPPREPVAGILHTREGQRALSLREVDALLEPSQLYDLLVSTIARGPRGSSFAFARGPGGHLERQQLTGAETEVLVAVFLARGRVPLHQLPLAFSARDNLFRSARRKLGPAGEAFRKTGADANAIVEFAPAPGLRYAFIVEPP